MSYLYRLSPITRAFFLIQAVLCSKTFILPLGLTTSFVFLFIHYFIPVKAVARYLLIMVKRLGSTSLHKQPQCLHRTFQTAASLKIWSATPVSEYGHLSGESRTGCPGHHLQYWTDCCIYSLHCQIITTANEIIEKHIVRILFGMLDTLNDSYLFECLGCWWVFVKTALKWKDKMVSIDDQTSRC